MPLLSLHRLYNPSTFKILNSKPLTIFCGCTAPFVLDLVGNLENRFSHDVASIRLIQHLFVCLLVCVPILTNMNISGTNRLITIKFYLKHHWGGGKAIVGFGVDWIRTLVSMATDSSHRVIKLGA